MAVVVHSQALLGVEGVSVAVEVDLLRRLPSMVIVGLAGGAVRESSERVRSAIQQAEREFPRQRVVVNLAPADLPKAGTAFDLPIAVGVLAASGQVPADALASTAFVGELSLDGQLRSVRGALSLALAARAQGLTRIVLPESSASEAAMVTGLSVLSARTLREVVGWLDGTGSLSPALHAPPPQEIDRLDLREVRGQARARRALEIAAAGGHNLLMVGPPGCGKSMLAARLPTILPALSFEEAVDITRIHSCAGVLGPGGGLVPRRPFRAPHHTISAAGMIGNAALQPGEISLAHHGVLFLDEMPEFHRHVLELLRGPLEDRVVALSRAAGNIRFPASFALVAASNPCPCGYQGHPTRPCSCSPGAIDRYRSKLSGPLLDRVDLQVWVQPVDASALVNGRPGEASEPVRARVQAARERQIRRYAGGGVHHNAELSGDAILQACDPTDQAQRLLRDTLESQGLSGRAWARILKVARTVADLEGAARVEAPHVLEASSYRVQHEERPA